MHEGQGFEHGAEIMAQRREVDREIFGQKVRKVWAENELFEDSDGGEVGLMQQRQAVVGYDIGVTQFLHWCHFLKWWAALMFFSPILLDI